MAGLTRAEKLEFLRTEVELIQSRYDKYDEMFYRNRQIAITIASASVGAAMAFKVPMLLLLASFVAIPLAFIELFLRYTLLARLVRRHHLLREGLNSDDRLETLKVYDPFDRFQEGTLGLPKLEFTFTPDLVVFYLMVFLFPVCLYLFVSA